MYNLAQVRHYSRKTKELNRFTSAIESKVTRRSWRGNRRTEPVEAKQSREAKQKESSCLFDGAIKGLFMFISHLKRSHKTSDCTHKPSAGHKSCHETECVWESPRFWYVRSKKSNSLRHVIEKRRLRSCLNNIDIRCVDTLYLYVNWHNNIINAEFSLLKKI